MCHMPEFEKASESFLKLIGQRAAARVLVEIWADLAELSLRNGWSWRLLAEP